VWVAHCFFDVSIGDDDSARLISRRCFEPLRNSLQGQYSALAWKKLSPTSPICRAMEIGYTDARVGLNSMVLCGLQKYKRK